MKLIFQYFRRAIRMFPGPFAVSMLLIFVLTAMDAFIPWGLRKYLDKLIEQNTYLFFATALGFLISWCSRRILAQKAEMMFQQTMKLYVSFVHVDELQNLPQKQGRTEAEE